MALSPFICNVYRVIWKSVLFRPLYVWPFLYSVNHSLSMLFVLYIMCTYHHKCRLRLGCCYPFHHSNLVSLTSLPLVQLALSINLSIHLSFYSLGINFALISGRNFLKVVDTVTFVIFLTENPTRFILYSDPYPLLLGHLCYSSDFSCLLGEYTSARNLVFRFI